MSKARPTWYERNRERAQESKGDVMPHTLGPWFLSPLVSREGFRINDSEGYCVAETDGRSGDGEEEANAQFIVKACNAHDEMQAALKLALDEIHHPGAARFNDRDIDEVIRAAIAKAEGKPCPKPA